MSKKLFEFIFKYKYFLGLFLVILIGIIIRSPMFVHGDVYILPDQGRDLMLVQDMVTNQKIPLIGGHTGLGGLFHGPLWWYMIVPFFVIFKGDPFLTLVPLWLLVNVFIIISSFFLGKEIYSRKLGFIVALLTSFSMAFVDTVSATSNSQVMPAIFALFLLFIFKYLKGDNKSIIIASVLIGLGIHFESAFAIFLIPSTFIFLLILRKLPDPKTIILSLLGFLIVISNFVLFDLRHNFLLSGTLHDLFLKPNKEHTSMMVRVTDRIYWTLYSFSSSFVSSEKIIVFFSLFILASFAIYFLYRRWKKVKMEKLERYSLYLLLLFVLIIGSYMFCPLLLTSHYIQSLSIIPICLISISILFLGQKFKFWIVLGIVYLSLAIAFPLVTLEKVFYTWNSYQPSSNGNYLNQIKAVDSVFVDSRGGEFAYLVYDPPIVTYTMDYLMWWRGKYKYNYIPGSVKLPITYLILNPYPPGDLKSWDFWIKYTVRTNGKVIKSWVEPGGIRIIKLEVPLNDPPVNPNYYISLIFR